MALNAIPTLILARDNMSSKVILERLHKLDPRQKLSIRELMLKLSEATKNPRFKLPEGLHGAAWGVWDAIDGKKVHQALWDALTELDDRSLARLLARIAQAKVAADKVAPWIRDHQVAILRSANGLPPVKPKSKRTRSTKAKPAPKTPKAKPTSELEAGQVRTMDDRKAFALRVALEAQVRDVAKRFGLKAKVLKGRASGRVATFNVGLIAGGA